MAIQRAWHRDGRRLVRSVRDRAVRFNPAKPPRQLAFDDVRACCRFGDDGPSRVGLREDRAAPSKAAGARRPQSSKDALQEAFRTQGFWLLTIGFFVCGFHVTFIGLHLPSYISDNSVGLSLFGRPISAIELAGWAIGLGG